MKADFYSNILSRRLLVNFTVCLVQEMAKGHHAMDAETQSHSIEIYGTEH
jgi:hypothetical protein